MKLLTFQASRFAWRSFSKTLAEVADQQVDDGVREAVVAFIHMDVKDEAAEQRKRVFRHTLKHLKWLANKREMKNIVLHSFTHLGANNAAPTTAKSFLDELDERLSATGYAVKQTPFGYFCAWDLAVYGDSLAKVWKEV